MAVLVIADHDNASLKDNTHKTVTAALAVPGVRTSAVRLPRTVHNNGDGRFAGLLTQIARQSGCQIDVTSHTSGVSFLTAPGKFTQLVSDTVASVTGQSPLFSTSGGTSDARFIKDFCPVVELGLAGATMHKADECVAVDEIAALTDIYAALLNAYFAKPPL